MKSLLVAVLLMAGFSAFADGGFPVVTLSPGGNPILVNTVDNGWIQYACSAPAAPAVIYACVVTKTYTYNFGDNSFDVTVQSTLNNSMTSLVAAFNSLKMNCQAQVNAQAPAGVTAPTDLCPSLTFANSGCTKVQ